MNPLKLGFGNAVVVHYFVQATPEYKLALSAFRLHIAHSDGHHLAVGGVINMAGNGGPWLHSLHVIEHDKAILEVSSRLHPSHEVDATPGAMNEHFEEIYLFLSLAREYTVVYELDLRMPLHLQNLINLAFAFALCAEGGDHVPNVRRAEHAKLVHHLVQFLSFAASLLGQAHCGQETSRGTPC